MYRIHFLTCVLSMVLCPTTRAQHQDMLQALRIAEEFQNQSMKTLTACSPANVCEADNYYIVSLSKRGDKECSGFVLVAKDKGKQRIIGYSEKGVFPTSKLPTHISSWMREYDTMDDSPQGGDHNVDTIPPLLGNTIWGQDAPYNDYCPMVNGERCPTGCVATALAQIMRYHQWPERGTLAIDYVTPSHHIPVTYDFSATTFEWGNMVDSYKGKVKWIPYEVDYSTHAVATLMQAVGAAVQMNYTPEGSGSNDENALHGLTNYLGYDMDMYLATPEAYTDVQWHGLLQNELMNGRPVFYTGEGLGSGHAFVIDGMQFNEESGNVYYHVNWGWDGLCNGYYLLHNLRPYSAGTGGTAGTNYSIKPTMFIGMCPDDGIQHVSMFCKSLDVVNHNVFAGSAVNARISSLSLLSANEFSGSLNLELRSLDNPQNIPVVIYSESNRTINPSRGMSNYYIPCHIPEDMPAGEYVLCVSCTDDDGQLIEVSTSEWPKLTILSDQFWSGGPLTNTSLYVSFADLSLDFSNGENGVISIEIDSIVNTFGSAITGKMALLLCDDKGTVITPLAPDMFISLGGYAVKRNIRIECVLSKYIPDGDYSMTLGYMPTNKNSWSFAYKMIYEGDRWWSDYQIFYMPFSVSSGIYEIDRGKVIGEDVPWTLSVKAPHQSISKSAVYDLQGRLVVASKAGIYLYRNSNRVKKRIVQ